MPQLTSLIGVALIAVALAGYIIGPSHHWTALIPAFFGLPLLILGLLAKTLPQARKNLMHAAVLFSLLGTLGGLGMAAPKIGALLAGEEIARFNAFLSQLITGLFCLVHVIFAVRSFILARKKTAQ